MSTDRRLLALLAALSSAVVSIDPAVIDGASAALPARPIRPEITAPRDLVGNDAPRSPAAFAPAPADLKVEITRDGRGHRVVVRRPGHLVALQYGAAHAAGKDWAAVHVEVSASASRSKSASASPLDPLVWESTPLDALTTARGLVSLHQEGDELRADLSLSEAPVSAGTDSGAHHTCAAHRDTAGGFAVLCRLHHGAKRVSVANVTGPRVEDDTWVTDGKDPLVRLDLPLVPGAAEARVVGFVHGFTGAVIRVEGSWPEGEAPALVIAETERTQPIAAQINWD